MNRTVHRNVVVVSNRVGLTTDAARAGGLAVALSEMLLSTGGMWFGWSGHVTEQRLSKPKIEQHGNVRVTTVNLTEAEYEGYYAGFSNATLWPLFHYRPDITSFVRSHYNTYVGVNQHFARSIAPLLRPTDLVWVHDYHLFPFAEELRRMGCRQAMGFFLHIPFPAPELLIMLPVHEAIVRAMFAYDVVGFQTRGCLRCFSNYVVTEAGGIDHGDGRVSAFGRTIRADVFPIGIDAAGFARLAVSDEANAHRKRFERVLNRRHAIIGVDRLDYSKGLPERFLAFERLLESYPENRGHVTYLQIAPPTRTDVPEYDHIREELQSLSGRVNGRYSEFDWTPLRYINRSFGRAGLAGLFRLSRVGLVTPLRDGMNLVAKEYVAAQARGNPGVLVLSQFAGAADRADGAIIVNPFDIEGVADALQRALNMPLEERKERWASLVASVRRDNVVAWRESFLAALEQAARGMSER